MHPESNSEMTFALEINGHVFFPIQDYRYNISALQKTDGTLAQWYRYSAFGDQVVAQDNIVNNPWLFANRREVSGLSVFTHRFYNPRLMKWQTTDPLGFEDGINHYAYVKNNPFYYSDPDGRFIFPIFWGVFELGVAASVILPTAMEAAAIATAAAAAYCLQNTEMSANTANSLCGVLGYMLSQSQVKDVEGPPQTDEKERGKKKPGDVYAPPRPLPMTPDGVPIPESMDPHTELGIEEGGKGKYPKAREFDREGEVVRDIEFTNHGRWRDHPNPHQHRWKDNPTGGSKIRDNPQPVTGWNYI